MSITIKNKPYKYHSGYNPVKYKLESTNKYKSAFRYVVQIFPKNSTILLAEFKIAPDPFDNFSGNIDISKILQNKLDGHLTYNNNSEDATETYFNYDIKFGESFVEEWKFNDYVYIVDNNGNGGTLCLTTDSSFGPGFSNTTQNYEVGDQILVNTDSNYTDNRQSLNTYFEIVEIVSNKTIRTNASFWLIGSFPATPGAITYANNKKSIHYNLVNVLDMVAINTALNLDELVATNGSLKNYELDGPTKKILTNQPEKYSVTLDQKVYFNLLLNSNLLTFENDNGDILQKNNTGPYVVKSQGVGPNNLGTLSVVSGTAPLIKNNTKWYEVYVTAPGALGSIDVLESIKYRFYLDRRCEISDTQIMFMDRKGSFNSFAFQLRKYERVNSTKKTFDKYVDTFATDSKGTTVYHSEVKKEITLNTNFMGEQMNFYFEELISSRLTYIYINNNWYACVITTSNIENEFERNKKHINKTIKINFAINNPIN